MELKDRWVFFVFLLLILFTLILARGEGTVGERRSAHSPPIKSAAEAVGVNTLLGEGAIPNIFLTENVQER